MVSFKWIKTYLYLVLNDQTHVKLTGRTTRKDGVRRYKCPCINLEIGEQYVFLHPTIDQLHSPIECVEIHRCGLQNITSDISIDNLTTVARRLFTTQKQNYDGATYQGIDALKNANEDLFGIVLATKHNIETMGDTDIPFSIQSISKSLVYLYCLDLFGEVNLCRKIGVHAQNIPFNVLNVVGDKAANSSCNNGALTMIAMVLQYFQGNRAKAFRRMRTAFSLFLGLADRGELIMDEDVFLSEMENINGNIGLVYSLKAHKIVEDSIDAKDVVILHTSCCALLSTAENLRSFSQLLLNNGVRNGVTVIPSRSVFLCNQQMLASGLYEQSTGMNIESGIVAKSGIGGGIIGMFPGKLAFCGFSPLLNATGNAQRVLKFLEELSREIPALNSFT